MINIAFKDNGLQAYLKRVTTIDTKPLMRAIAGDMQASSRKNFDAQGRPGWQGLEPGTMAQRGRKGKWPGRILQVSGLLRKLQSASDEKAAIVGTNLVYAKTHQYGARINHPGGTAYIPTKRGNIWISNKDPRAARLNRTKPHTITVPARPFLSLQRDEVDAIQERAAKFFLGRKP